MPRCNRLNSVEDQIHLNDETPLCFIFPVTLLTVLHHDGQEAHNDLGAGSDEDLAFPTLLSIVDAFQSICENVHAHHDACKEKQNMFYRKTCIMQLLGTEY